MASLRLEECGRVLISTDHRLYALDCSYCSELHTNWETFLAHIKAEHKQETEQQERSLSNVVSTTTVETPQVQLDVEKIEAAVQIVNTTAVVDAETSVVAVDSTVKEIRIDAMEALNAANADDCNDDMISIEYLEDELEMKDESEYGTTDAVCAAESLDAVYNGENVFTTQLNEEEYETAGVPQNKQHLTLSFETSTPSEIETFIAHLKQHKCLWQREYIKMLSPEVQQEALLALSKSTHKSIEATKESTNYLLRWFAKAHQFSNAQNNTVITHKYYALCEFLVESLPKTPLKKRQHPKSAVNNAEHTFRCNYCGKHFLRRKYLDVHLRRHTKELMYKCEICNKLTATSSDLRTHMRVHTGEKPYACDMCGKTFKTSSVLCQHQRKHQKPSHQCTLCSKAYYNSYQLKNHMNVHLNKRVYKCVYCEKAFTSAKLLYGHKLNMHSELRSSYCKICQKCKPNIEYHMKQTHGEFGLD